MSMIENLRALHDRDPGAVVDVLTWLASHGWSGLAREIRGELEQPSPAHDRDGEADEARSSSTTETGGLQQ